VNPQVGSPQDLGVRHSCSPKAKLEEATTMVLLLQLMRSHLLSLQTKKNKRGGKTTLVHITQYTQCAPQKKEKGTRQQGGVNVKCEHLIHLKWVASWQS